MSIFNKIMSIFKFLIFSNIFFMIYGVVSVKADVSTNVITYSSSVYSNDNVYMKFSLVSDNFKSKIRNIIGVQVPVLKDSFNHGRIPGKKILTLLLTYIMRKMVDFDIVVDDKGMIIVDLDVSIDVWWNMRILIFDWWKIIDGSVLRVI